MSEYQTAVFAGGCFWCMVQPFDSLPGIKGSLSNRVDENILRT